MTDTPALELRNCSKSFGGLQVVIDVSFSVAPSSCTALIGPNGAGKTTLFNLITGAYSLDAGQIFIAGSEVTNVGSELCIAAGAARTFQNIRLMPHLSAIENVILGQTVHRQGFKSLFSFVRAPWIANADVKLAIDQLRRCGLEEYHGQAVSSLPYGVQKRIEVARALMGEPKILLLDEPSAGLNHHETAQLRSFIGTLRSSGMTVLLIEHDMSFVHELSDNVIVLNFGQKIAEGPAAVVVRDKLVIQAYLGEPDDS